MKCHRAVLRASSLALAASAAFGITPARGADPNEPMSNAKFYQLDRNKDGLISRDEVKGLRDYGVAFDKADANKDGKLDRDEFLNAESIHDRIVAGKYVDDSVLTARVKAALLKEPELKSLDVSVETQNAVVLLSGFVSDEDQRRRAKKAAVGVSGVASVKDAMVVR